MGKRSIVGRAQYAICQEITELILDYITGELDSKTVSALEEHLRLCPDCDAFLKTYKKTVQATRSLHYENIPPEMQKRVRRFLREKTKAVRRGR